MCVTYNVPENNEIENNDMGMYLIEAEYNNNPQNRDLIQGREQRERIVRLFQNHYVGNE